MVVKERYSVFLPCLKEIKSELFFTVSSSSGVLESLKKC